MDDNTLDQLYEIRKNAMKMLDKRGYGVDYDEMTMSLKKFKKIFGKCESRTNLNFTGVKIDDSSECIYVYFTDQEILKVIHLRAIVEALLSENYNHVILILRNKPQHFVQASIAKLSGKIEIELFQESELLMDITEYFLVPEHILLTSQEALEVEKQIRSSRNKLPRLRLNDPISRYYGYKAGDVVKIIRPSDISGRYITYRVVL